MLPLYLKGVKKTGVIMKRAKNQLLLNILLIAACIVVTAVFCPYISYAFDSEISLGQQDKGTDVKIAITGSGPPEWLSVPVYIPKRTNTGIAFNKTNTVSVDIPGQVREPELKEFKFRPVKHREFKLKKLELNDGEFKPFRLKKTRFKRFRLKELKFKPLKLKKTELKKLSVRKLKLKPFKFKIGRRKRNKMK